MESQSPPPPRPPRPLGASQIGGGPVVTTAVPPLYANSFDVSKGDYDFTIKFQQRDPYLEKLAEQDTTVAGQQAQNVMSQLPAAVVSMSPQAVEALWEALGEAIGRTPKEAKDATG